MPEDILTPNIKKFAAIQAVLTEGLGFGGDKLRSVLDRSDEFGRIANESNLTAALKDDLDAFSVAVGLSVALKEFAAADVDAMVENLERMQKAEDN